MKMLHFIRTRTTDVLKSTSATTRERANTELNLNFKRTQILREPSSHTHSQAS